ncbi:MAG: ABC transporter ATP-binding protein [Clostridiales bacterium]|nr:ABC transporter ATP-binding protein [Clostridiales bacterium]
MGNIIEAIHISRTFETPSGSVAALRNVDCTFEEGLFYAVIGKSGSGKSTLLHILGGLDRPTSGIVRIKGEDLSSYTDEKMAIFRRRHMGFVFQQFNLLEEYSVLDNICMPLRLDRRRADQQFLAEVLGLLGIEGKKDKYPSELSGGEQQRVAIARSVIAKPALVFADEPTGNLDKKSGEETMGLLKGCATRFGQTLIVVTHDLDIAKTADRIVRLEDGKVVE